ncbi:TniB family NTP-binding protein [Cupriavidus necator]|uniref:TniB family NTP-binding protein n=1 Tax=Cupriavidus necator TaxID=106590 RepID=UPI002784EFA8|nr:TniB family NTP-binding protein [Cupriavidus necator]MDQ0138953.1 energy-coupling factor transporter ATP-binding protein EcfA2 [Cupriavidus necator]
MSQAIPPDVYSAIAALRKNVFMFPRFRNAFEQLIQAIELYRATGVASNHLILGSSGCGKSTLCKLLVSQYPERREPERNVIPVLYMEIPALATIKSLVEGLLSKIGDPAPWAGTISDKTARLCRLVIGCGVFIAILDEMQHVRDRGQDLTVSKAADWIKAFSNSVGCPFALVGLPRTQYLLDANEQLRRRFSATIFLERFNMDDPDSVNEFAGVVISFLEGMPLRCSLRPDASIDDLMQFYYATDGRIGYLASLLSRALLLAHVSGAWTIDQSLLERAFSAEIWYQGVGELNPFSGHFCGRSLSEYGEPFYAADLPKKESKSTAIINDL